MGLAVLLSLLLGVPIPVPVGEPPGCNCSVPQTPTPAPPWDDDDWDDDDWVDDDTWVDDDDGGDDDAGDDDSTPPYTGEIDMAGAFLYAACTVTEAQQPDIPNGGAGWFDFGIELRGWAEIVWIELRDMGSNYCEAYDPATGEPCQWEEYARPGWDMHNTEYGWSTVDGFWDDWTLQLAYDGDLAEADASGASWFLCEAAGQTFATWFCGVDMYSQLTYCTSFPMEAW